jgi:hypothetical protein
VASSRRRPSPLSAADVRTLAFAAEHRFVLPAHITAMLGVTSAAAGRRLRRLTKAGHLARGRSYVGEGPYFQVTRAGLAGAGSTLPVPRPVDLSAYRHDTGVASLMVLAEHGRFGPLREIVSERAMRSHDNRAVDEPPYGVRIGDIGRDGRERLHHPDLLLVTDSGHRVAFELELTGKGSGRRERILAGYGRDRQIDAIVYFTDTAAHQRAIQRSARQAGMAGRVRVERVKLRRPLPPTTSGARERTTRRAPDRPAPEAAR